MIESQEVSLTVYFGMCDECGTTGPMKDTPEHAEKAILSLGWRKIDNQYFCPEHAHARRFAKLKAKKKPQ